MAMQGLNSRILYFIVFIVLNQCLSALAVQNATDPINRSLQPADSNLEQFGLAVSDAWNEKNIEKLSLLIDFKLMGERAAQEIFTKPKEISDFTNAFTKSASQTILGKTMNLLSQTKGHTRFIRLNRRGIEYRPVIRFDLGESGYDYQECVVQKDEHGDYKIVDWFQLSQGELVSKTLTAAGKQIVSYQIAAKKNLPDNAPTSKNIEQLFKTLNKLELEGKYAEAASTFEKLPPEILDSKVFMIKRVLLASLANNTEEYKKMLSKLAEKYGDDPSGAFILIDYYFYNGDLNKSIEAIQLVETDFVKDGVTTQLKAGLLFNAERFSDAIPFAQESIELEPDREDSYWILARSLVSLKQFSEAVEIYKKLEELFSYKFASKNFSADPKMKDFVKSSEFKKWMKSKR